MKLLKPKFFRKAQAALVLTAILSVQVTAALDLCLCSDMDTSAKLKCAVEKDALPCTQVTTDAKSESPKNHDHSCCDCEIDVQESPQLQGSINYQTFEKVIFLYDYQVKNEKVSRWAAISHNKSPPDGASVPLYKITQRYLN